MSRHLTQDIANKAFQGSEAHHHALRIGQYGPGRVYLDLPDDFDWSGTEVPAAAPSAQNSFGLGDAVAALAQPIAKTVDAVAGTNLTRCGGCQRRREKLNQIVPDLKKPFG